MAQLNLFTNNIRSSIKIPALEEQHKELLGILTTLTESVQGGKSREAQNRILLQFLDYAVYHFKKEAQLIEKHGYGEYHLQYKNEQELLKRELDELGRRVRTGDFVLDSKTLLLLKTVFQSHVFSAEKYLVRRMERR